MADLTYVTITTEDDYLRLAGVDLNEDLKARLVDDIGDDNPAPRFIYSVENFIKEKILDHNPFYNQQIKKYLVYDLGRSEESLVDSDYNILNENYQFKTERQTDQFKKAVCYQISYLLKHGNVTNNISEVLTQEQMEKLGLDCNARRCLFLGGLWNIRRF